MVHKSINQIKKELRFIKNAQHAIETYMESEAMYKRRIDWLSSHKDTESSISSTKEVLSALEIKVNIERLTELEKFYLTYINRLDDNLDKMILTKVYIQGRTYYSTAMEINFSYDGLKTRIKSALYKLSRLINEGE